MTGLSMIVLHKYDGARTTPSDVQAAGGSSNDNNGTVGPTTYRGVAFGIFRPHRSLLTVLGPHAEDGKLTGANGIRLRPIWHQRKRTAPDQPPPVRLNLRRPIRREHPLLVCKCEVQGIDRGDHDGVDHRSPLRKKTKGIDVSSCA